MNHSPKVTALIEAAKKVQEWAYDMPVSVARYDHPIEELTKACEDLEAETPAVGEEFFTPEDFSSIDPGFPNVPSARTMADIANNKLKSTQPRDGITVTPEEWEEIKHAVNEGDLHDRVEAFDLMREIEERSKK